MSVDIIAMTPAEFDAFTTGYQSGYLAGQQAADDQQAARERALHHEAYLTVQAMAKLPTHDELERQRRTYNRPAWAEAS
ncbi:MAG: hypothetical protein L0H96_22775 [Humibacillus sp.]|nr:hypothetical protein [Humibacillus sp.]MDN5779717.1 hypothetical protein [Humibacillus sp.]